MGNRTEKVHFYELDGYRNRWARLLSISVLCMFDPDYPTF